MSHHEHQPEYNGPRLLALATYYCINEIPEKLWIEPSLHNPLNHENRLQNLIAPWISFIHSAKNGYEIAIESMKNKTLAHNHHSIRSFNQFNCFSEKIDGETEEKIASLERAFTALANNDIRQQLGINEINPPTPEDIANAKLFVHNVSLNELSHGNWLRIRGIADPLSTPHPHF